MRYIYQCSKHYKNPKVFQMINLLYWGTIGRIYYNIAKRFRYVFWKIGYQSQTDKLKKNLYFCSILVKSKHWLYNKRVTKG